MFGKNILESVMVNAYQMKNSVMENVTMQMILTLSVEISVNTRMNQINGGHVMETVIKGITRVYKSKVSKIKLVTYFVDQPVANT